MVPVVNLVPELRTRRSKVFVKIPFRRGWVAQPSEHSVFARRSVSPGGRDSLSEVCPAAVGFRTSGCIQEYPLLTTKHRRFFKIIAKPSG